MTLIELKKSVDAALAAGAIADSEVVLECGCGCGCGCGTSEPAEDAYIKADAKRGSIFQIFGSVA